jgi:hypothetical protein
MRDIVDVSYDADPNTGVLVVQGGVEYTVGGTSAGSPQWAALVDLANEANGQTYGAVDAKLYKLSSYHDITFGSDTFFTASPGWDYPTGLGTPDSNMIASALSPALQVSMNSSIVFEGVKVATSGSLGILIANKTVSGTALVIARNDTTGQVLFNTTYTIPNINLMSETGTLHASFLLSIGVSPYPLSSNIRIKEEAGTANVSVGVTRRVDVDGNGMVGIGDLSIVAIAYHSSFGAPNYNGSTDIDGNGTVDVSDLSIVALYYHSIDII